MKNVQIIPNKVTGATITPYESNPEFGYIALSSVSRSIQGGWVREQKRNCLLRGNVEVLNQVVASARSLTLPGKIVVQEFIESEVPESVKSQNFNKKLDYEDSIANFIKKAGEDGDVLTKDDERILRFSTYDETGMVNDIIVQHDTVGQSIPSGAATGAGEANFGD